ncbi:MAG: hypothetical protein IPM48_04470 [Saprospiraceae bacterium]|nr:hypothetical protein [Saprospiraceae bacterium]
MWYKTKHKFKSKKKSDFRSLILILVYVFGWSLSTLSFLHNHHHHSCDHSVAHDITAESDPCHRSIFHADKVNGCKHDGHFQNTKKECFLCSDHFASDVLISKIFLFRKLDFSKETYCNFYDHSSSRTSTTQLTRGPPYLI